MSFKLDSSEQVQNVIFSKKNNTENHLSLSFHNMIVTHQQLINTLELLSILQ